MRVLLVNDLPPQPGSGAEVHVMRLAAGLRAAGDTVELFVGRPRGGLEKILDLWDPLVRRRLRATAASFAPDVVHLHNVIRELSPSVFGAVPTAAAVLTVHDLRLLSVPEGPVGSPFDGAPLRWMKMNTARFARALARRHVDETIAPSAALAGLLGDAGFSRVHHVAHFADPGPEPPRPPSASSDVLYAGRLSREKGVWELVDAFVRLAGRHRSARLIMAGDGKEREGLVRHAEASVPGRVTFTGTVAEADVAGMMRGVRVVAAPSTAREAAGLSVLEAALAGRPVVVSDDPALRELPDESGCGVVVTRGDVGALTDALEALLVDPVRCDRMGADGRRWAARERSTRAGISRTRAVYEAAIARARARRSVRASVPR